MNCQMMKGEVSTCGGHSESFSRPVSRAKQSLICNILIIVEVAPKNDVSWFSNVTVPHFSLSFILVN